MDGLEATRIIRQDKLLHEVPIIAVTSYAMSGDEAKAFAAGCQGYVSKPIDTKGFLEYIKQFVP